MAEQSFDERREQRVREEEHVSAVVQTAVDLSVPRIREKYERQEGVPHENERVKLEKDPNEQTRLPTRLQHRLHLLAVSQHRSDLETKKREIIRNGRREEEKFLRYAEETRDR